MNYQDPEPYQHQEIVNKAFDSFKKHLTKACEVLKRELVWHDTCDEEHLDFAVSKYDFSLTWEPKSQKRGLGLTVTNLPEYTISIWKTDMGSYWTPPETYDCPIFNSSNIYPCIKTVLSTVMNDELDNVLEGISYDICDEMVEDA